MTDPFDPAANTTEDMKLVIFEVLPNEDRPMVFAYIGRNGLVSVRSVSVPKIEYGTSSFYPDYVGWFITAFDQDRQAIRSFRCDRITGIQS